MERKEEEAEFRPDCETARGCLIPSLGFDERRIIRIRDRLMSLKGLVDPGTIMTMYRTSVEDLELLAAVEQEIKSALPMRDQEQY